MKKGKESINRPVQKYRIGNIEASIWQNSKELEGNEVGYKTVTLSRSFKKKDEDLWRSEVINNLRRQDLQKLRLILEKVEHYLFFEDGDTHE